MAKKNIQYTIYNIQSTAFTIVELLVAMSLLVILLALSSMVFSTTVAAHRAAGATINVSRNLRAITDQLNADFRGLQKDAPLCIAFNALDTDGDGVLEYYDTIHFFADGDFQTTKQYDSDNDGIPDKIVHGNMARIYYGHANSVDAFNSGVYDYSDFGLLVRKSHILTSDAGIQDSYTEIPLISNWPITPAVLDYTQFPGSFGISSYSTNYPDENELEFNTITLTNWINALNFLDPLPAPTPNNADHFIVNCMTDASRPQVDLADIDTLHLLLAQGILQMQVQWAYTADDLVAPGSFTGVRWWPSVDPDMDGTPADSDFAIMNGGNPFGVYFTMLGGTTSLNWTAVQGCGTNGILFKNTFYPKALKFTIVLTDSNGIFADGKSFTHIVYIDN